MSPRRRTLCFVVTLLSLNNGLVFVTSVDVGPVLTEYYPSSSFQTPQLTNSFFGNRVLPESLPTTPNIFPNQRLGFNNALPYGSYPQSISTNTVPTFYANPNVLTTYSTYIPPTDISNPLPTVEQTTYSPDIDSLTIVENHSPITQTVQVDIDSNSFDFPSADVANIYQTPVSAQMSSTPLVLATPQLANPFLAGSVNRFLPETLPGAQRMFPNPLLSLNSFPYGSYQQDISACTLPTSCCATPNVYTSYSAYVPPVESTYPLPIVEQIPDAFYTPDIDSLTIIENNSPVTQTVQVDVETNSFDFPSANVVDVYQTPITVQAPSTPQVAPFVSVAPPLPEILPAQNCVPEICPQTIETCTSVPLIPIETSAVAVPSYDAGYCCQPYPITLQVNMPPPCISEPVIAIIQQPQPQPQAQPAPCPYPSYDPSFGMPPQPIIVMEKSNCRWKSILPILFFTLFDCGCGNCGGGCGNCGGGCGGSQCCTSTPVPFPIVIPVNNPIVNSGSRSRRGKGKSKPPNNGDAEVE